LWNQAPHAWGKSQHSSSYSFLMDGHGQIDLASDPDHDSASDPDQERIRVYFMGSEVFIFYGFGNASFYLLHTFRGMRKNLKMWSETLHSACYIQTLPSACYILTNLVYSFTLRCESYIPFYSTTPSTCYILSDILPVTYFPTKPACYILSDESTCYILSDESPSICYILSDESSLLRVTYFPTNLVKMWCG